MHCIKKESKKGNYTLKNAAAVYLDKKENVLSPSTILGYKRYLKYFESIEELKLSELSNSVIQLWINNLSLKYSPKTVRNANGLLSAILADNEINITGITLPQKIKHKYYVPSDGEIKAIIDYFKN